MPDTVNYMLLGYAVLFGMPLLYVLTWWLRRRNLEKDLEMLRTLSEDKQP